MRVAISWIASSAAISGQIIITFLVLHWRWRHRIDSYQPGEWLAIFSAIGYALRLADLWIKLESGNQSSLEGLRADFIWQALPQNFFSFAWFVLFASLALQSKETIWWKLLYGVGAINELVGVALTATCIWFYSATVFDHVLEVQDWFWSFTTISFASLITIGAITDHRRKYARRWTHWAGIAFWVLGHAPYFIV